MDVSPDRPAGPVARDYPLLTTRVGRHIHLSDAGFSGDGVEIEDEQGTATAVAISGDASGPVMEAPATPGYYRLHQAGRTVTLAVAPARGPDHRRAARRTGLGARRADLRAALAATTAASAISAASPPSGPPPVRAAPTPSPSVPTHALCSAPRRATSAPIRPPPASSPTRFTPTPCWSSAPMPSTPPCREAGLGGAMETLEQAPAVLVGKGDAGPAAPFSTTLHRRAPREPRARLAADFAGYRVRRAAGPHRPRHLRGAAGRPCCARTPDGGTGRAGRRPSAMRRRRP
jgi:hypothetical protein